MHPEPQLPHRKEIPIHLLLNPRSFVVQWYWQTRLNKKENKMPDTTRCPNCGSIKIETEDYLNPCANAACKLNGVYTYHLGCGSQYRDVCAVCSAVLYDSAEDEIENAEWEAVEYICSQCEAEGIQPGHFACGETYWIPK